MAEASWGDAATPEIDWRMSAALENVLRGEDELAEMTNLEGAVRAWLTLDPAHRAAAVLTPEHPLLIDGASIPLLSGDGIATLADRLPDAIGASSSTGSSLGEAS